MAFEQTSGPVIVNFSHVSGAFGGKEVATSEVTTALTDVVSAEEFPDLEAIIDRALGALEEAETLPHIMSSPDHRVASLLQTYLAERSQESGQLEPIPGAVGLEAKFDKFDVWNWIKNTGAAFVREKLGVPRRDPLPPFEEQPTIIPDVARIALLGDWGTADYGAPVCAESIKQDGRFDAVVHLGDVYYSGSAEEVDKHFLRLWPFVPNAVSRACNSNHEMYSGGGPYLNNTLPRFAQSSPSFVLENEHWMVIGLDTAYYDHDLGAEQVAWIADHTSRLNGRGLVLFSHHQLYSHQKKGGGHLRDKLAYLLERKDIFAWYWGHEHALIAYDQHPKWGLHARCVGHGGYPYFRPKFRAEEAELLPEDNYYEWILEPKGDTPSARLLDGPNECMEHDGDRYGPNGYMAIELTEDAIVEAAYLPNGVKLWNNTLLRR